MSLLSLSQTLTGYRNRGQQLKNQQIRLKTQLPLDFVVLIARFWNS